MSRLRNDRDEYEDLLVFGYTSRLYENDERSNRIADGEHLIPHPNQPDLLIDRYDCRLNLCSLNEFDDFDNSSFKEASEEICPTEALEEELCEEERYKDFYEHIRRIDEEEIEKRRKAEISFNYDEKHEEMESSSSEEEIDEPFQEPEGIKLPVGMNLPETMKENAVIERTATFIVEQGAQMEIVIKAKQRGNSDQFGFLDFDHPLNPYYKYISRLIREKKYIPKAHVPQKRPKPKKLARIEEEERRDKDKVEALSPLSNAEVDTDSEYDSDGEGNYLHPLLMGGARTKMSDSEVQSPMIGPKNREDERNDVQNKSAPKSTYILGKANDMYSSLFNNLTSLVQSSASNKKAMNEPKASDAADSNSDGYTEWHVSFYGEPPSRNSQHPIIPTPPDLTPALNSTAKYVAKYGYQAEQYLLNRQELHLNFLNPSSPYYTYYQSRIRYYQWYSAIETQNFSHHKVEENVVMDCQSMMSYENKNGVAYKDADSLSLPGVSVKDQESTDEVGETSLDILNPPPPPTTQHMNRKMRRRGFHDPPSTLTDMNKPSEVGLVEPHVKMMKVQSSPAMFSGQKNVEDSTDVGKKLPIGPISFSLIITKAEDIPLSTSAIALGVDEDDDELSGVLKKAPEVPAGVVSNFTPIPPPPSAPVPLSSGELALEGSVELQNERRFRARLFMKKILTEKRAAKLRAVEQQKSALENTQLATVSKPIVKNDQKKSSEVTKLLFAKDDIDKLIKSKIDKVINDSLGKSGEDELKDSSVNSSSAKTAKKERNKSRREEKSDRDDGERSKRKRKRSSSRKRHRRDRRRRSSSSDDYRRRRRSRSESVRRYRR